GHGAADHRAAAPAGPRAEGCGRGVALDEHDVIDVHAQVLGDDLDHRRLETLTVVATSHQDVHGAVGLDAHGRDLGAHDAVGQAPSLDVEAEAHAEVAAAPTSLLLRDAEPVVVEYGRGLVERLGRADVVEHDAARRVVGEVLGPEHVAAPELERIDA